MGPPGSRSDAEPPHPPDIVRGNVGSNVRKQCGRQRGFVTSGPRMHEYSFNGRIMEYRPEP